MKNRILSLSLTAFCLLQPSCNEIQAQTLPPNFFSFPIAEGFEEPTSITFLGSEYVLVSEKSGKIKRIKTGVSQSENFFQVETETSGERGLQSILVHPNFPTVPYFFLYYTKQDGSRNRLSRVKIFPDLTPGNEEVLAEFDSLKLGIYHNGGALSIFNDKIYLAIGDQFELSHSENLDSYSGKLLRFNLDGTIPGDNPQRQGSAARKAIWSYGLRNPFTMDIDRVTGKIFVNDVGYGSWEEINEATAPFLYFGWPYGEGNISHYNLSIPFVDPAFRYANNITEMESPPETRGCAITSGSFYRPDKANFPARYTGKYFFSDICNGWIRTLDQETLIAEPFATGFTHGTLGLKTGTDGSLYYLNFVKGTLNKITYEEAEIPRFLRTIDDAVSSVDGKIELNAYFSGSGSLRVTWFKNGEIIQDGESHKLILYGLNENSRGYYRAVVQNEHGSDSSNIFKVAIKDFNATPVPEIRLASPGQLYSGGDTIFFEGTATDFEDDLIDESNFKWTLQFHHETHYHPGPQLKVSPHLKYFIVPRIGEISTKVWFRLILTVGDSNGASATSFTDIFPSLIRVNIVSEPDNINLLLDGKPIVTPHSFASVAGGIRELTAKKSIIKNGKIFVRSLPALSSIRFAAERDSTIVLTYDSEEEFSGSFPNPADSFFTLKVACIEPQAIVIRMFTTTGILCYQGILEAQEGANSFTINSTNLKPGVYYTSIEGPSVKKLLKVSIQ
jgi:glucose/arabinose dehydrogenase